MPDEEHGPHGKIEPGLIPGQLSSAYLKDSILGPIEQFKAWKGEALWKKIYPRRIASPQNYVRHEILAMPLMAYLIMPENNPTISSNRPLMTACAIASISVPLLMPTWYVGEELLLALLQTNPPEDILLRDLKFPMPAFNLMLPMTPRTYEAMDGRHMPYIQVASVKAGTKGSLLGREVEYGWPDSDAEGLVSMLLSVQLRNYYPFDLSSVHKESKKIKELCQGDFKYSDSGQLPKEWHPENTAETQQEDQQSILIATRIFCGVLAIMNSRPQLVETLTQPMRREKKNHKGEVVREELWDPNYVGRTYRILREKSGVTGTHASPKTHWRCGHMAHQAHGPKMSLRKIIWREPVMVNT